MSQRRTRHSETAQRVIHSIVVRFGIEGQRIGNDNGVFTSSHGRKSDCVDAVADTGNNMVQNGKVKILCRNAQRSCGSRRHHNTIRIQ